MNNFQRKGSISNAHVGRDFETLASQILSKHSLQLESEFIVSVGVSSRTNPHKFDLGSNEPKVIVECKSHTWTSGDNIPSAKHKNWSEAMYYFAIASVQYRKIFFIQKSIKQSSGETLGEYYQRTHFHLIPPGVEFWECSLGDKSFATNILIQNTGREAV